MGRAWSSNRVVRRNPGAVWRSFEAEVAVLDPAAGRLSTLNEVAARCWELADGRSFGALIEQLLKEFDVSRIQVEADVSGLLDELAVRGLLAEEV